MLAFIHFDYFKIRNIMIFFNTPIYVYIAPAFIM